MSSSIRLKDSSPVPATPSSGYTEIYVDPADSHLKVKDDAGAVTDLLDGITDLTGDGVATGPGSVAFTLATVNSNVGSFGTASQVPTVTLNAKGLATAASNTSIQIAESQVTNLVSDLAGKQPTGNYVTALTGDVTASGPGSVAATVALVGGATAADVATATSTVVGVKTANTVFAGPTTGSPAAPSFRTLGVADVPDLDALLPDQTGQAGKVLGTDGSTTSWVAGSTGTANTFAGFDSGGIIQSIPGYQIDTNSGGMNLGLQESPDNDSGGFNVHYNGVSFQPLQNSPNENWLIWNNNVSLDAASSGFTQGTAGNAITVINNNITHNGTGDVGALAIFNNSFNLGNGTDPITVKSLSFAFGFGNIEENVEIDGPIQGYGFQTNMDALATMTSNCYITGFYDYSNFANSVKSYNSFAAGPTIDTVENNFNYVSYNSNPNIADLVGNASCYGAAFNAQIGAIDFSGQYIGVSVNPTVTLNRNSVTGIYSNVSNVTNYAGLQSSLVVQDITYEFIQNGDNDNYTIEYADTVTAGSETCVILGNAITMNIESGVSTATQVAAACAANLSFIGSVSVTITGTASNPQVTQAATNFTGGVSPGRKLAAEFVGDVNIQGGLTFTGGLSIGALTSFATLALSSGTGTPVSIDTLITQPTVAANATLTLADTLAVNTAMLLNIGDNATVTTAFLGVTACGLPAVLTMGSGATIDRVGAAAFALSLDAASGGGTVDEIDLCRAIAIPNGVTTVNKLKGFFFDLPFGDPGTDTWGFYGSVGHNYMGVDLKVGGGSDIADSGYALHVQGDVKLHNGTISLLETTTVGLGFFAATPVAQQSSSGPATAGALYTGTEQTMIQEMYNALRAYGLLT